jgi:hypothetical protein
LVNCQTAVTNLYFVSSYAFKKKSELIEFKFFSWKF